MFNSALNTIYDEHRSLGAVVQGLRHLVKEYRRKQALPDFRLLHAIVFYLDEFPVKLHHPKEEAYLFARLSERTRLADRVIEQLRQQHIESGQFVDELHSTLAGYERDIATGLDAFAAAVDRFSDDILRHMALEESSLMPLARRHLNVEDWVEIGVAFGSNGDPRFVADADHAFAEMFRRLLSLASPGDMPDSSAGFRRNCGED